MRTPVALVCMLVTSVLFIGLPKPVAAQEQQNAQMEEIVVTDRNAVRFRLNDPEYYFLELSYRFR